jgi:hypothetical protein
MVVSARLRELFGHDAELIQWLAEGGWWFDPIAVRIGGSPSDPLGAWRNGRGEHATDSGDALTLELAWLRERVASGERMASTLTLPLEPSA